jgi:hypothetical protein
MKLRQSRVPVLPAALRLPDITSRADTRLSGVMQCAEVCSASEWSDRCCSGDYQRRALPYWGRSRWLWRLASCWATRRKCRAPRVATIGGERPTAGSEPVTGRPSARQISSRNHRRGHLVNTEGTIPIRSCWPSLNWSARFWLFMPGPLARHDQLLPSPLGEQLFFARSGPPCLDAKSFSRRMLRMSDWLLAQD